MTDIEKLDHALLKYLEEPHSDYAIILNGEWGSGKTHYLKNHFKEFIKDKNAESNVIYVSLFGITDIHDLNKRILIQLFPMLNNDLAKSISSFGKIALSAFGSNLLNKENSTEFLKAVGKLDEKSILIFDDLERLNPNLLLDVIGFISQLVEHEKVKVLIAANEQEITEGISHDEQVRIKYSRYLEKLVRYSITFNIKFKTISAEIFTNYGIDKVDQAPIIKAFEKSDSNNLRILQFICSVVSDITSTISKRDGLQEDVKSFISEVSIYFGASLGVEIKSNPINIREIRKLASWSMQVPFEWGKVDFSSIQIVGQDEKNEQPDKEASFQQGYFDKYHEPNSMMYFDSIVNYLIQGFWDEDLYNKELDELVKYIESKSNTEEIQVLNSLYDLYSIEDNELEEIVNKVLEFTSMGVYQLKEYPQVFNVVRNLKKDGYIKIKGKQLLRIVSDGIECCKDQNATPYLRDFLGSYSQDDVDMKKIIERILKRNSSIIKSKEGDEAKEHYNLLITNPAEYENKFPISIDSSTPSLNSAADPKSFLKSFYGLSVKDKTIVSRILASRTPNNAQFNKTEMKWMRDLVALLEKSVKKKSTNISKIHDHRLLRVAKKLIDQWSSIEPHLED